MASWFGFRCRCQEAIKAFQQAVSVRLPDGKAPELAMKTLTPIEALIAKIKPAKPNPKDGAKAGPTAAVKRKPDESSEV
ncbi:MAG: hypothetical protein EXS67_03740 [Candidatus Margulisbacteria bacterium]|nr:hypothetical protein [Candidatus Margulisiibacteriota bacterium]